jgi:hypothetical protein
MLELDLVADSPLQPSRALRLAVYGTVVFGPLTHYWHNLVDKIRFPESKIKSKLPDIETPT